MDIKIGIGSGRVGFNTMTVHHDLEASAIICENSDWGATLFPDPASCDGVWRRHSFRISEGDWARIREIVEDSNIPPGVTTHASSGIVGGTQMFVVLRYEDGVRRVWCDNATPAYVSRIFRVLRDILTRTVSDNSAEWIPAEADFATDDID